MTYVIKLLAKISLGLSSDAHTRVPPAESWFGSAIDPVDTILREEDERLEDSIEGTIGGGAVPMISLEIHKIPFPVSCTNG